MSRVYRTGAHVLRLHLVARRPGMPERFEAECACGLWHLRGDATRTVARERHAAHLDEAVASGRDETDGAK